MECLKPRVPKVWGLAFGVWSSAFSVWGLAFGVQAGFVPSFLSSSSFRYHPRHFEGGTTEKSPTLNDRTPFLPKGQANQKCLKYLKFGVPGVQRSAFGVWGLALSVLAGFLRDDGRVSCNYDCAWCCHPSTPLRMTKRVRMSLFDFLPYRKAGIPCFKRPNSFFA